jgi:hypothetical protein
MSAAVFTGTVVAARQVEGDPLGPTPPIVYSFRADQVYKGKANAEFEVATNADEASCGYGFDTGSRYLVFASAEKSGMFAIDPGVPLHTSLCEGNQLVHPGRGPLHVNDGVEPLTAELLAALGTATPPTMGAARSSPDGAGPGLAWVYAGAAMASLGLAFAGWRFFKRRKA